jgi:hypothetical protein
VKTELIIPAGLPEPILVTKAQLDQLEERGYLNPGDPGTRADECEAIASFLTDSAGKI